MNALMPCAVLLVAALAGCTAPATFREDAGEPNCLTVDPAEIDLGDVAVGETRAYDVTVANRCPFEVTFTHPARVTLDKRTIPAGGSVVGAIEVSATQKGHHLVETAFDITRDGASSPVSSVARVYGVQCLDRGPCVSAAFNPETRTCIYTELADGAVCGQSGCDYGHCMASRCIMVEDPCDDGVACTEDVCRGSTCQHRPTAARCDDEDPCTADTCAATSGCQHETLPDNTICAQNGCASASVCVAGECLARSPEGLPCDDGLACTPSTCTNGACVSGEGPPLGISERYTVTPTASAAEVLAVDHQDGASRIVWNAPWHTADGATCEPGPETTCETTVFVTTLSGGAVTTRTLRRARFPVAAALQGPDAILVTDGEVFRELTRITLSSGTRVEETLTGIPKGAARFWLHAGPSGVLLHTWQGHYENPRSHAPMPRFVPEAGVPEWADDPRFILHTARLDGSAPPHLFAGEIPAPSLSEVCRTPVIRDLSVQFTSTGFRMLGQTAVLCLGGTSNPGPAFQLGEVRFLPYTRLSDGTRRPTRVTPPAHGTLTSIAWEDETELVDTDRAVVTTIPDVPSTTVLVPTVFEQVSAAILWAADQTTLLDTSGPVTTIATVPADGPDVEYAMASAGDDGVSVLVRQATDGGLVVQYAGCGAADMVVPPGCAADADCPTGYTCSAPTCVPAP